MSKNGLLYTVSRSWHLFCNTCYVRIWFVIHRDTPCTPSMFCVQLPVSSITLFQDNIC